jgi:hypothetical protein
VKTHEILWPFIVVVYLSRMLMRFAYMKLVIDRIIDKVRKQNLGSCYIILKMEAVNFNF